MQAVSICVKEVVVTDYTMAILNTWGLPAHIQGRGIYDIYAQNDWRTSWR